MRVAVDATSLLGQPTGVGAFTRALVDRLAAHPDVDLRLFAVTWRGRHELAALTPPGVPVGRLPVPARVARALWPRIDVPPVSWLAGSTRIDVVHGPNFVVPPGRLLPRRFGGRPGAAELLTVHDLTCVRYPELCTTDTLQYPDLIRRALQRGAHIHAVSAHVGAEVCDVFDVSDDRVTSIPNGFDPLPPSNDDAETSAAHGRRLAGSDRFILALGTVEPRKDLVSLVEAFDLLADGDPDVRLVLAGPNGWGAESLTAAIGRSRSSDRIRRLGWVSSAHRAALLRGAAVLAYPSRYEGFGLPPLEAMAAGTPVVTTRAGALPETVGDAGLLVPVGDAAALADALASVLDPATGIADDLVARGARRASDFSWDRTIEQLVALYGHLRN